MITSLSAAKHAGDRQEAIFWCTQLEQLCNKEVALREEKRLLLRARQGGGHCSKSNSTTCLFSAILTSVIEICPSACTLVELFR